MAYSRIPPELNEIEFSRVHFAIDFLTCCELDTVVLPGIRRNLRSAGGRCLTIQADGPGRFAELFEPQLSLDPVAVKRFQKPAPAFVIQPFSEPPGFCSPGDRLFLEVIFLGKGTQLIGDFARCLDSLGSYGLLRGEGEFEMAQLWCGDAAGQLSCLWEEGQSLENLAPNLINLGWFLDQNCLEGTHYRLNFRSPARLMSDGKPLFRATARQIFPFLLRRVSSMLYSCCHTELQQDLDLLLDWGKGLTDLDNRLTWHDWRNMKEHKQLKSLGGLVGGLDFTDDRFADLAWIFHFGSLLGIGKGAAYGSGLFRFATVPDSALANPRLDTLPPSAIIEKNQ